MNVEQDDTRFDEVDKPYTSLGKGWMPKAGRRPFYALGAVILVMVLAVGFVLSKTGHKDGSESAVEAVSNLEARLEVLGARVDKLQGGLEQINTKIGAVEQNTKTISALQESIRSLGLEVRRLTTLRTKAPVTRKVATSRKPADSGHDKYHVVKKGETLYRIAKNYRISLSRLVSENHLTPKSVIHPGDRLKVGW